MTEDLDPGKLRERSCCFIKMKGRSSRIVHAIAEPACDKVRTLFHREGIFLRNTITVVYMRGFLALLAAKHRFKPIYPVKGSWGMVGTSTPKKQVKNESGEEGLVTKENIHPIVTFSRPPPLPPPVLGPVLALSLLETWFNRDTDGDDDR